jgi:hypothetical protein
MKSGKYTVVVAFNFKDIFVLIKIQKMMICRRGHNNGATLSDNLMLRLF